VQLFCACENKYYFFYCVGSELCKVSCWDSFKMSTKQMETRGKKGKPIASEARKVHICAVPVCTGSSGGSSYCTYWACGSKKPQRTVACLVTTAIYIRKGSRERERERNNGNPQHTARNFKEK
jgi:hypothetical protein